MKKLLSAFFFFAAAATLATAQDAPTYSWQQQHAKVLPTGGLEWAPKPFEFKKGAEARYIDFDAGNDANDGKTIATAWKRHPFDPAFGGRGSDEPVDTYIFKRGVIYRGVLQGRAEGTADRPILLTSDPAWGEGEAVIVGSEAVTGWTKGADHPGIPEREKVWYADLDFSPRNLWAVAPNGETTRIPLAREPNWTVTDPEDVMSNWYEWEQPEWWINTQNKTHVNGRNMHLGVSQKVLSNRKAEDLVGGIVWTEYGICMGQPLSVLIEAYEPERNGIAFQGPWFNDSYLIITGNRYFLEDRPAFLDDGVNGEFWFDKKGDGGRLYLRLPGDADPSTVRVEAARHIALMDFAPMRHVEISGLTFRFTNVRWNLWEISWMHRDVMPGVIYGFDTDVENVTVANCRFENIHKAVRFSIGTDKPGNKITDITIRDNDIRFCDHGAIEIGRDGRQGRQGTAVSEIRDVNVLRNRIREAGHRMSRADFGHTLVVNFAEPKEIAGNILERLYGGGIVLHGGKGDNEKNDAPFARTLVHHNSVSQALLACNDWGSIENFQGGPIYFYNNVSINPCGYWNCFKSNNGTSRLAYAYYLDGSFKGYVFNNIAWGANNDITGKYGNRCAFYQAVPCTLNAFFNNTAYRFIEGTSWSPAGGRQWFLGNLWDDFTKQIFIHGKQKEDADAEYETYLPHTIAYSRNAFRGVQSVDGNFGGLEGAFAETTFDGFKAGADAAKLIASDVGVIASAPLLRDPANFDMRPAPGAANAGKAVKFFIPWSLSNTVGEWQFRRDNKNPSVLLDEAWWMTPDYVGRDGYKDQPRNDLKGAGITAADFVDGPLEDWAQGAIHLKPGKTLVGELRYPAPSDAVKIPSGLVIELFAKFEHGARGAVLEVVDEGLSISVTPAGNLAFTLGGATATTAASVANGQWCHILAEYSGADATPAEIRIYMDGKRAASAPCAIARAMPADPFVSVGGNIEFTLDFLRVALSSLAQSRTTIEELYAWQFDGPHLRDFTGKTFSPNRPAGALDNE